jgi:glycosyltransferase involved in cell wall biosynthesis
MGKARSELSILLVSHAAIYGDRDMFGPAHNVVEHLAACGYDVDFVLHPIQGDAAGFVRSFHRGALVHEERVPYRGRMREVLSNIRRLRASDADVIVLVDPLNYASALVPSFRSQPGPRVRVYFTADYADRRFAARLKNTVYHQLDRLALRRADLVWSVSDRIAARRLEQGVDDADSFVIPNAPPFDPAAVIPWNERAPDSVVCMGMFDPILDWDLFVDAMALLSPERPGLRVRLVGDGPDKASLLQRLREEGLEQHVELCGLLPHEEALEVVSRSRMGLALYSGRASWNEYGDSLKVREYMSRGVPVVTTPWHPLADELRRRGAGHVVQSAEATAAAIAAVLDDVGGDASQKALQMAADADRTTVLNEAIRGCERRLRGAPA